MIKWLLRLLFRTLWGAPPRPDVPLNVGSGTVKGWTYGDVVTNVYLNHNRHGKPYYKVTFRKLVKDGRNVSNSFFIDDLENVQRGIVRVRAWVHDSENT